MQLFTAFLVTLLLVSTTFAETEKTEQEKPGNGDTLLTPPIVNTNLILPRNLPVPGGIAVVPLNMRGSQKPIVKFGSRAVFVVAYQDQWHAVVGLPIDILPGNYILGTLDHEEETGKVDMHVISLPPPPTSNTEETDTEKAQKSASRGAIPFRLETSLAASDMNKPVMRIPDELLEEERALSPSFVFTPVVESDQIIPFGKIMQQKKIITHNYLSYLAAPGSQVYSPAPGIVVKVIEDQGRSVELYIHHGGGIISVLGNLEKILVQEGQSLDRGEQIGKADFDGTLDRSRVDFGVSLNGFLIDPLQLPSSP